MTDQRNDVLVEREECAKVAELRLGVFGGEPTTANENLIVTHIAAAIRARKTPETPRQSRVPPPEQIAPDELDWSLHVDDDQSGDFFAENANNSPGQSGELVERVAKALCRSNGLCVGFCHIEQCPSAIEQYGDAARAAIAAMPSNTGVAERGALMAARTRVKVLELALADAVSTNTENCRRRDAMAADTLYDIAVMMSEFVVNWPQPKKVSTALELIAKTMRAALSQLPQGVAEREAGIEFRPRGKGEADLVFARKATEPYVVKKAP